MGDGRSFTKYSGNPVLDLGAGGTWDDGHVYQPSILRVSETYLLYYSGTDGSNYRIGLAEGTTT